MTRLQKIALGEVRAEPARLAVQVAAARVLLAKVLPDQKAIEMSVGRSLDELLSEPYLKYGPPPPSIGATIVEGVKVLPPEDVSA